MYPTDPSPPINPITAAWNTVARFDDYEAAQRAVDRLSDDGFPVEKLDIIGTDLRTIERVTGRLTTLRAAGSIAARMPMTSRSSAPFVLPPIVGGLHCGVRIRIRAQSSAGVLHGVDSASSGDEGAQASGVGATAVNGPLRQAAERRQPGRRVLVVDGLLEPARAAHGEEELAPAPG